MQVYPFQHDKNLSTSVYISPFDILSEKIFKT